MPPMRMYIDKIQDYAGPAGEPGHCRLWMYYGAADNTALVVLTEMPDDAGPGLVPTLAAVATRVLNEQGMDPAKTLWFTRKVMGRRLETFTAVEFQHHARKNALTTPRTAPATREAVENLVGIALPPIAGDEHGPIFGTP